MFSICLVENLGQPGGICRTAKWIPILVEIRVAKRQECSIGLLQFHEFFAACSLPNQIIPKKVLRMKV
jgi:hypothetical protein